MFNYWNMITPRVWDATNQQLSHVEFLIADIRHIINKYDAANFRTTRQSTADRNRLVEQLNYHLRIQQSYEKMRRDQIKNIETIIREATEYGANFPNVRPCRNSSDALKVLRPISEEAYDARMSGRPL